MARERDEALEEFLTAFDQRLDAAPVVERREQLDRRAQLAGNPINGRRAKGPVKGAFAYWESKAGPKE